MRILGISIGGTKTAITFADFVNGNLLNIKKTSFPTIADDDKEEIKLIFNEIDKSHEDFEFISIIVGGPLDTKRGTINNPPHLKGFKNTPIVEIFKNKYNVEVKLLNDADACALAEYKYGAGRDSTNMAYITFGTGIGAGLILDGKLYCGANSMAGEIGHVQISDEGPIGYGKVGSVEGWCAGGNIYKWANIEGVNNTKELFDKARSGDNEALSIVNTVATKIGKTSSVLVDILNLDKVVIGGIYPRNLDLLEKKVNEVAKENSISLNFDNCEIVPSYLNEKIDDYSSLMGVYMVNAFNTIFDNYKELIPQKDNIEKAIDIILNCYKNGGKILVCGNGGSASDSAHIVGELMKGFMSKRPLSKDLKDKINSEFDNDAANKLQVGVPCIDLTSQSALLTAFSNDVDPELIFAQQVIGYSSNSKEDVVIGLSTSGNSKNVVNAIKTAKSLGLKTISLTGSKESELSRLSSVCIKAPSAETYRIQEYHLPIYHYICQEVEKKMC